MFWHEDVNLEPDKLFLPCFQFLCEPKLIISWLHTAAY